jgi:hypothetical protein
MRHRHRSTEGSAPQRGRLSLAPDSAHLDDIRLAMALDPFPRIARAIIVAFALDGAKDSVREQPWCGPRALDVPHTEPRSCRSRDRIPPFPWATALRGTGTVPSPLQACLIRNVTGLRVSDADTRALCALAAKGGLPRLEHVSVMQSDAVKDGPRLRSFVTTVAEGLRSLQLIYAPGGECDGREWATVVAQCTSLETFELFGRALDPPSICRALVQGGAPPCSVAIDAPDPDAAQLLDSVRPLTTAAINPTGDVKISLAPRTVPTANGTTGTPCPQHGGTTRRRGDHQGRVQTLLAAIRGWKVIPDPAPANRSAHHAHRPQQRGREPPVELASPPPAGAR